MIKKYIKHLSCTLVFSVLLVFLVINSIGCSQFESKAKQNSESQISKKETEGGILVTKYMAHVSKGEIQEADKFLAQNPTPEVKDQSDKDQSDLVTRDGPSPILPWSSILYERNLVLTKIINEKTEGEITQVDALLEVGKRPDINISATFYLAKVNGSLLIKDIKLIPGKSN